MRYGDACEAIFDVLVEEGLTPHGEVFARFDTVPKLLRAVDIEPDKSGRDSCGEAGEGAGQWTATGGQVVGQPMSLQCLAGDCGECVRPGLTIPCEHDCHYRTEEDERG